MAVVNEIQEQGWPDALLTGWIATAGRALSFSFRLSAPAEQQEGADHHRHRGMAVIAGPAPSLEVIQSPLLFELLMDLALLHNSVGRRVEANIGLSLTRQFV